MRVAIVHDYLVNRGGAERVAAAMLRAFPDAPIFTSLYHPDATYPSFAEADVRVSRLQRYSREPGAFRRLLPLFPRAFRSFDLSGFDVVMSSSSGFAHHVRVPPGACHVVYAYSPPRFLWDRAYDVRAVAPRWARPALAPMRSWLRRADLRAARRPHFYLAVSKVAARRIHSVYGRSSTVLHPPVDVQALTPGSEFGDHFLMVGRMLPYRNQALAVRAFTEMQRRLVVVGDGPARAELEALAGPTIEFRGVVEDEELQTLYRSCRAVVVPGEEDFGLAPLEANAAGRPAIAFGRGGALETVVEHRTGVLFRRPTTASLIAAVERFEATRWDRGVLRAHAERWSESSFAERLETFVAHARSSCIECARSRRGARFPERGSRATDEPAAGEV